MKDERGRERTAHRPLAVLGAGSWGTALAILLARNGLSVRLWGRDAGQMEAMRSTSCNNRYLPDASFPSALLPCSGLDAALDGVETLLLAAPSHAFGAVLAQASLGITGKERICWATKGLENGSGRLLHDVAAEIMGRTMPLAVISGPTFAREVAAGLPTAVTVASPDRGFAEQLAAFMRGPRFRAYTSDDIVAVELGGAVKNVLAVAAGIADGLGFGANTRAALITRGLAEMMRLGAALGGRRETFMGLSGLGDLALTCTDNQSRNRRLGLALARGATIESARREIGQEVEGVHTAAEVERLAQSKGVDMPICHQAYRVLHEGLAPDDAVRALLAREPKAEYL